MRVEDFDSRIKQKVGHIEPQFQEKDWLRFQQKFQASERTPWKRWLLLLLLLVTVGGVAFTYMRNTATGPTETSHQKQIILADNKSGNKEFSESDLAEKSESIQNENSTDVSITSTSAKTQNNKKSKSQIGTDATDIEKKDRIVFLKGNVQTHSNENSSLIREESNPENENLPGIEKQLAMVESTPKINLISITNVNSSMPDVTKKQPDLKLQKPLGIDKWAAGLSLTTTKEHLSFGGLIERKTNSNVSFRSGLLYQNFYEKVYQNEIAFKEDNQVAFTEIAKPRHSTTEEFSNIRIQSTEVVCPLELKYTIPFSSKLAAFVFGGLQLTLQSKTVLDFDYLNHFTNQYLSESGLDQATNSSTLINNFVIGVGLQRNFAGLQWSVAGVMQKSNSNLPHISKRSWGAQAGVSYAF